MSVKGVRFDFEPGEYVLCFEPDPSKARVLYDAKILDVNVKKDSRGKKKAEYHIHFQGWNSSWDRMVPECFILKGTEYNRNLMERLADTARLIKNNKTRNRRIDDILKKSLKRKVEFDSDSSSSSSEDEEDDNEEDDNEEEDEEQMSERERSKEKETNNGKRGSQEADTPRKERSRQNGSVDKSEDRNGSHNTKEEEDLVPLELNLPLKLRQILEDDSYYVVKKKKLLKLPAEPNVITVLESYVRSMAVSLLNGPQERPRTTSYHGYSSQDAAQPEKNIRLCKEVMEGLRIFFDFTLPKILLYSYEKNQHKRIINSFRPAVAVKREVPDSAPAEVYSPRLRSSSRLHSPATPNDKLPMTPCDRPPHSPVERPPPKIPRLSPKVTPPPRHEAADTEDSESDELPSRRMTRHAYQEEIRKCRSAAAAAGSGSRSSQSEPRKRRHTSGEHRKRLFQSKIENDSSSDGDKTSQKTLSDRMTPPPPLLIPNTMESKGSTGSRSPLAGLEGHKVMNKEVLLNQVFLWKLVPEEVLQQTPTPPSQIYGPHHLLRLFVKLPEMLGRMSIPQVKLKPLEQHLEQFLQYLSDHSEEFLAESSYVDDPDWSNIKHPVSSRH